jgi:hypothetical protein
MNIEEIIRKIIKEEMGILLEEIRKELRSSRVVRAGRIETRR